MKELSRTTKRRTLMLIAGALALGVVLLLPGGPSAAGPEPDCGPTREWNCVIPGCPECPEILFEGTVCEKVEFEAATGRVCS